MGQVFEAVVIFVNFVWYMMQIGKNLPHPIAEKNTISPTGPWHNGICTQLVEDIRTNTCLNEGNGIMVTQVETHKKYFLGLTGDSLNLAAIILIVMPAIISFGYNQSLLGGLLDFPAFEKRFPEIAADLATGSEKKHKTTLRGTVVALYAAGGIIGSVSCVWLGDIRGRRFTLFVAAIVQLIGAIIMTTSYSFAQLIVSRIILGLGTGGLLATVTVWQSEISNAKRRGSHVSFVGVFLGMGLCLSLWLDFGFFYTSGEVSFRVPFVFQVIFSFMVAGLIYMFPESPRYLMKKGRVDEAEQVMLVIEDGMTEPDEIRKAIRDQQTSMDLAGQVKFWDFCRMGPQRTLNRTILAVTCLAGLQLTGVNAITFYTSTIFGRYLGLQPLVAKPLAAVYQMTSIVGGSLAAFTVERFGRKTLMITSAAGNAICMACLAALLSYPDNKSATKAATFFVYMYHFVYVIGWGGVPFLYASEIAPLAHRAAINGLAVGAFWAFNFMIGEVSPDAYEGIGVKYMIVWACTNFVLAIVVYFFFPETSGRSLEEIDEIFAMADGWLDAVRIAKRVPHRHLFEEAEDSEKVSGYSLGYENMKDRFDKPIIAHEENAK